MTKDEERLLKEKYAGKKTSEFEADRHRLTQHPVGCPDAGGEPVAYVIGWQPFLGLKIHLDSRPLIPRPETEWWTEEMLRAVSERSGRAQRESPGTFAKGAGHFRFLDLCAGSGAVGCAALARLPEARVYFGELDPAHDATIRKNIRENGLDAARAPLETPAASGPGVGDALSLTGRADIRIGDLFAPFGDMKFDVIATNPPYVPENRMLPESVTGYEPALALRAGTDGLSLISRIAEELPQRLTPGGVAWVECDSAHAEAAGALIRAQGFAAEVRADQYGAARLIVVSFLKS